MQHSLPANAQAWKNPTPPGLAIPQAQHNPCGPANPQAQNNLQPPGHEHARARNVLSLRWKYHYPPANTSAIHQLAVPMFIPGMPVRVQHALANVPAQNNPPGTANPQAQNQHPPRGPGIPHARNDHPSAANSTAHNDPPPPGPAIPQAQNNSRGIPISKLQALLPSR